MFARLLLVSGLFISTMMGVTTPTFADRYDYAALCIGPGPAIAAGDVNNDGIPDLVCSPGPLVLFGNGDGTFSPGPISHVFYGGANSPVLVDLNGDGNLDVIGWTAANNQGPFGLVVSFGNGDGTFQSGTFYQTGNDRNELFIVTGDFNGDGVLDMATQTESGIWLFTGVRGGVFNPGVLVPVNGSGGLGQLAAIDVNGDGKLDIIASINSGFTVLLGNGNGTFKPEIDTAVPIPQSAFASADLNGDGRPDVFVVSGEYPDGLLYLGRGDGTFILTRQIYLASEPFSVAIADVNGDGFPDIISSGCDIVFGNGKGGFSSPVYYPISSSGDANYVLPADLRKNGRTDLVFVNFYAGISVLLSLGKGRYQDGEPIPVTGGAPVCAVSADFNGDGIPDLAVGFGIGNGISILLGTGKPLSPYTQGAVIALSAYSCPLTGDLNGDGIPDLLVTSGYPAGTALAYLGKGDGTFTQVPQTTPLSTNGAPALGDFNGDGKLDFALTSNLLAYGKGDGTFQTPVPYIPQVLSGSIVGIATARLNADRATDIVLTDALANLVYVLLSNGQNGFAETTFNSDGLNQCFAPFFPTLADVNGDGKKDLVLGCGGGNYVPIYLNDGQGSFKYSITLDYSLASDGSLPIVADVNGDGVPDVLVSGNYEIGVFVGLGSMTFAPPFYIGHGTGAGSALVVNAHGQHPAAGRPDLVVTDLSGVVYVYLNTTK